MPDYDKGSQKLRFLITGLNSITGWQLFRLTAGHFETHGTFRKPTEKLRPGVYFHRTDMEDRESLRDLLQHVRPDYLVHAWAICDLDLCEAEPALPQRINVEGTRRILELASEISNLKKFVYISTDHVFNGDTGGYAEDHPTCPKHQYGKSKEEAERLVRNFGLPYLIIRPGLVIGDSVQGNKGPKDWLLSRIHSGKPTHLFVDEWRTPVDAVELSKRTLQLVLSGRTGIYHVSCKTSINRYELGKRLAEQHGLSSDRVFPKFRHQDNWAAIRPKDLSLKTIYESAGD
ncbi:MAG: hypothetical protein A2Z83_02135 [Omnitrophica bacterium GWA2_52_8]|nr:MAG: hypothetical protein A2Z83_02135 [Omnitrophica bacterium GWA2_52_8]